MRKIRHASQLLLLLVLLLPCAAPLRLAAEEAQSDASLRAQLDAPLLFVKRHNYRGIHIYDTYYKWGPGGGIYVIENPSCPPAEQKVRTLIDPTTAESLGPGVYSDPDISWDAQRVLFCFKPRADANTCIYEIGIDGKGLRQLTDPGCAATPAGRFRSHHDVGPAYLPDGRIVFTSTRPNGVVPCNNTGVDILHVMNADGTDIRCISVNNVNEFDPCVLPDGRILHGRWEYIDKTALTQQSVWTTFPDGTNETALFANNMVHPEAVLDARPVPGSEDLVAATFTPHNSPPRGSIALIDPRLGKDSPGAIVNLEHPENPTFDRGDSCEPWPLSDQVLLYSGRAPGHKFNAIMLIDRDGHRVVVCSDPAIDCHSPMLLKPRPRPRIIAPHTRPQETTGRFFLQDIYRGLAGVKPGEVKWLRVIEETSRASASPGGSFNQTFLISAALGWSPKNFLGIVPVEPDGSAYFEAPSGRAIYFQALDAEGRIVQSMRTFIQAAPGVTRSCIGCHEHKYSASETKLPPRAFPRAADRLKPESWGSGFVDYPSMIQPIFDKHCVACHGGRKGIAAKLDLSGGWTEYFNISYENLATRRDTQLTASLIAGIDCMNGTSLWSAQIFRPRGHGSGAAPLAEVLTSGHEQRFPDLTRAERDLVLAWIDTNGIYHGTWDYSKHGCSIRTWKGLRNALVAQMQTAGCARCHGDGKRVLLFEDDWINLQRPEFSRILRAPLAEGKDGWGLGFCRDRKIDPRRQRICLLVGGRYHHAVLPLDRFAREKIAPPDAGGEPVASFASTEDEHYQAMLAIIRRGRSEALGQPRVDMPGAEITPGECRMLVPPPVPENSPPLAANIRHDHLVELSWQQTAGSIGLQYELHRGGGPQFAPNESTCIGRTTTGRMLDAISPGGKQTYALLVTDGRQRSRPAFTSIDVPRPPPPPVPLKLSARPLPGQIVLAWEVSNDAGMSYSVYRAAAGREDFEKLNPEPLAMPGFCDANVAAGEKYVYAVRSRDRQGRESSMSQRVEAAALAEIKQPVFVASFEKTPAATLLDGKSLEGRLHAGAKTAGGALVLGSSGHATFDHLPEFGLGKGFSVECRLWIDKEAQMPVVLACGAWQQSGWFLQRIAGGWRWHLGGQSCDGGRPAVGRWVHLVGTFDGRKATLYQDGKQAAEIQCAPSFAPWSGPLVVGQYSSPAPQYQVSGRISGVKIYRRALKPDEIAGKSVAGQ